MSLLFYFKNIFLQNRIKKWYDLSMKNFLLIIFLIITAMPSFAQEADPDKIFDLKQSGFALYNTNNIDEAFNILQGIEDSKKDEETYLILANIEEERGNNNAAYDYLQAAIEKNPKFYKAYYNLGCLYMKKRIYTKAIENFELAVKYNKENPYCYYNLACAQMNLGKFSKAKKNFIKAIMLKNDEKNFYYNLAYVNKKMGKEKAAKKIIKFYNETFVKS